MFSLLRILPYLASLLSLSPQDVSSQCMASCITYTVRGADFPASSPTHSYSQLTNLPPQSRNAHTCELRRHKEESPVSTAVRSFPCRKYPLLLIFFSLHSAAAANAPLKKKGGENFSSRVTGRLFHRMMSTFFTRAALSERSCCCPRPLRNYSPRLSHSRSPAHAQQKRPRSRPPRPRKTSFSLSNGGTRRKGRRTRKLI